MTDDAESIIEAEPTRGPAINPPTTRTTFADVLSRHDERRPIVPASLRTPAGRQALASAAVGMATHGALWHLSRTPLYLGKVALYAPWGLLRLMTRQLRWALHPELSTMMREAARSRELDRGEALAVLTAKARQARFGLLGAELVAVLAVALLLAYAAPWWAPWAVGTALVPVLAWVGNTSEKGIVEHAFNPAKYVRLTAELTRRALMAARVGIKDPGQIKFDREIYRDGPGYTAQVSLPVGVIAADVIENRPYLAAGFQLPEAQVWPEPVKGAHPGVLAVWVADRPVDRMRQLESPLLTCDALDFWGPLPWGQDVRMRPVSWRLDERNSLFGGMPGSGKTLAARNVLLAAAMDPLVQFAASELKGSGDLDPIAALCGKGLYASGADDRAKQMTMEILHWLHEQCEIRPPLIRKLAEKGLNSQNKLNRAMAEADPRLFPLVAAFDEIQELFTDPELGKEAKALLISIVKRGRSLGIHLIPATQRLDKDSIPKGLSSNITSRLALAVPSHVETDLILGTGAYNRGARPTAFVAPADEVNPWAGWGYLAGKDQPVRASYIDNPAAEAIALRARALRGDREAMGVQRQRQERDVLQDVIRVFAHVGRPGLQWQKLAELMAEQMPEAYRGVSADAVSALVRGEGVDSVDVKDDGRALKGCRLDAVRAAAERRGLGR
jgi:S-DNA-T family DNA segregation ATPase FtsK/SpoIIIE